MHHDKNKTVIKNKISEDIAKAKEHDVLAGVVTNPAHENEKVPDVGEERKLYDPAEHETPANLFPSLTLEDGTFVQGCGDPRTLKKKSSDKELDIEDVQDLNERAISLMKMMGEELVTAQERRVSVVVSLACGFAEPLEEQRRLAGQVRELQVEATKAENRFESAKLLAMKLNSLLNKE